MSGWRIGASASSALSSVTSGRSSYSTSTRRAASSAASLRLGGDGGDAVADHAHAVAGQRRPVQQSSAQAHVADVGAGQHRVHAGHLRARPPTSTETMRACGATLRVYASHSMPGMCTSAV